MKRVEAVRPPEDVAGEDADALRGRITMLRQACATALSLDELLTIAVAQARSALTACAGALLLVEDGHLVAAASEGYPADLSARYARTPIDDDTPAGRAAHTRQAVWISDPVDKATAFPAVEPGVTGFAALAALPVTSGAEVLAVLGISFRRPRRFSPVERLYLLVLADQVGLGLRRLTAPAAGHALIDDHLVADPDRRQAVGDLTAALADAAAGVDRLTALAAALCDAPSAQVSLIAAEQLVASAAGDAPAAGTVGPARDSLCTVTMSLGAPLVVPDAPADERVSALPPVRGGDVGAYLGVPLDVDGVPVGALCVYDRRVRDWPAQARETLEVLAASVGNELRLRSLAARDARLVRASRDRAALVDRLATAVSLRQVAAVLADAGRALPGAVASAVVRFDDHGVPETLAGRCADPRAHRAVAALAPADPGGLVQELGLVDLAEAATADAARLAQLGVRRAVVLRLHGQTTRGVLVVALGGPDDPAETHARLLELGPIATAVLDRGAIHEQHRLARARAAVLTTASAQLQSSLDVDETLQRLARVIVPTLADGCLIHLREHRALRLSAVGHVDRRTERALRRELPAYPQLRELVEGCLDGGPAVGALPHPRLPLDRLRILPLRARGRAIGAITLIEPRPGGQPRPVDPGLLAELATRTAIATDNALLYAKRAADVAALQYRLLPPRLPVLPEFDLAAHYEAGDGTLDVGGDFYDVVALAEDHFVVVIGDVCGRGADAAGITGHGRSVLRTVIEDGASPATALSRLNRSLLAAGQAGEFCTAVVAEIRGDGRRSRLRLALAGHPAPLLRHAGAVVPVGGRGPMLGMLPGATYRETERELVADDVLLLFTDGVTEARRGDELFGTDRLVTAFAAPDGPADIAVETVRRAAESFRDRADDDVAMVAVRPRGRQLARVDLPELADPAGWRSALARLAALLPPGRDAVRRTLLGQVDDALRGGRLAGSGQLAVHALPGAWRAELTRPRPPQRARPTFGDPAEPRVRHGVQTILWTETPTGDG